MEENKIKFTLQEKHNPYVIIDVKDKNNKLRKIYMHGYLVGMEIAFAIKKKHEFHNLVIVTGDVGSGKSTLTEGLAGINSHFNNKKLTFDNVSWATDKFIEKTDRDDNRETAQWWDESIQGATGRSMALTKLGNKLKIAFVTKRFKRHTYYLAIDEINEYSWKLIKMADAWIHVKTIGLQRGYFNAYTSKNKIKFIYKAFKEYNKDWNSKEVRDIYPDCKGKFDNYHGLFLDPKEYDSLKLEETKQIEDEGQISWSLTKTQAFHYWTKGLKYRDIAIKINGKETTLKSWVSEFKKVVGEKV